MIELPPTVYKTYGIGLKPIKLIMNTINGGIVAVSTQTHSIASCVKQALESYPLKASQLAKLSLDLKDDFKFGGHRKSIVFAIYKIVHYAYTTTGNRRYVVCRFVDRRSLA